MVVKLDPAEKPPSVLELEALDDKYLALERACEKEIQAVQRKYVELQRPILEERAALLAKRNPDSATETGTPALEGFWLQAVDNHPMFEDFIQDWDKPVLKYLSNITTEDLDAEDSHKGFKLLFHFAENPYFTNRVLEKQYFTEEDSPYTQDLNVTQIKGTVVEWRKGKDVTVHMVAKKKKGSKSKKTKKEEEEPRDSFFRDFFRDLEPEMEVPDDVAVDSDMGSDPDDDEIIESLMDRDHDLGSALKDEIIPFAVRWYTGEAAPDDDDEESEEEDGDDDDELDDDDESEDEEDAGRGRRGRRPIKSKASENAGKGEGKGKEECDQQ